MSLESGKQGQKFQLCLGGQARDDDFQLVYAAGHEQIDAAAAGARSPTTDTLVFRLSAHPFNVDQLERHTVYHWVTTLLYMHAQTTVNA
jgi:hypothetical protein